MSEKFTKFYNLFAPILISGETGTGKSRLAKNLYEHASINKEKFLTVHLASIKEELFESELFGHKKGAFTGAVENKNGYLKEVGAGTLFLDEIGELSLESQKKLLYLLEEKKYVPVGGVHSVNFEGRIIMATNRNLEKMVAEGTFRKDLYYRLMIFQITLTPLRENPSELKESIKKYFEYYKNKYQNPRLCLSPELQEYLEQYSWAGNIRELKNCLESMTAMADTHEIGILDLPSWMKINESNREELKMCFSDDFPLDYGLSLEKFEEKYLRDVLSRFDGRINETARRINISKVSLISKAKKYRINTLKMRVEASEAQNRKVA